MRERINKFIEFKNLTPAEFADRIGVQRSNVSHVLNGRNNPSYTFIEKIIRAFDDINAKWLLTGIGNMMLEETTQSINPKNDLKLPLEIEKKEGQQPQQQTQPIINSSKPLLQGEDTNVNSDIKVQSIKNKVVTRVVIFYNDHTFIDYIPSEN